MNNKFAKYKVHKNNRLIAKNIKITSGITLVALVVTIVIILILAAISLNLLLGDNGIIKKAVDSAKFTAEKNAQEKVELILQDYAIERDTGSNQTLLDFLNDQKQQGKIDNVTDNKDGTITVEVDGFDVIINESDLTIIGIEKTGVKPQITTTIYQTDGTLITDTATYNQVVITVKIDNKNDFTSIDSIKLTDSLDSELKKEDSLIGDSSADASYIINTNGIYKATVVGTKDGVTKSTTVEVPIVGKIAKLNIPEYWTETTSSNSNWYNYGTTANAPKLVGGMTPIIYSQEVTGNKWANAAMSDGSMFVWIPRYAYKITSGWHSNTAGTIQIKFIDTNNNFLDNTNETITTDPTSSGAGQTTWLVHPAFTANAQNGGGFGELTGLWVGKFETTGTLSKLSVKPGIASLRSQTVDTFWNAAKSSTNASFGESVDLKPHMAKNSEWGAIAYLSHSSYGINGANLGPNRSGSFYTGGSNVLETVYGTNAKQSTTLNPYGVYDLNGGAWEYVAAYLNNGSTSLSQTGASLTSTPSSTEYKTVYTSTTTTGENTRDADYALLNSTAIKRGDAVYETSNTGFNAQGSWFTVCAYFPYSTNPFIVRGGYSSNSNSGPFYYYSSSGTSSNTGGFRECLAF